MTSDAIAKVITHHNLAPTVIGEGKQNHFIGIWAKNSAKWLTTLFAAMKVDTTVVGFYDSMSLKAVDFIVGQTELSTMFCTLDYLPKIEQMRNDGLLKSLKNVVIMEDAPQQS